MERWLVQRARAVVTVSPPISEQLALDYGLATDPIVVRNTPQIALRADGVTVREVCMLDPHVALVVYSGGITARRGIGTLLEAVQAMPGTHLAVVAPSREVVTPFLKGLDAGFVAERLHVVPFVAPSEVAHFLSSADVCVHPLWTHENGRKILNHAWALPNKWFEYIQARVPVVVSDVEYLSQLVRSLGIGEVFHAEDSDSLQVALRRVLAERRRYADAITDALIAESTWQVDGNRLLRVYANLLDKQDLDTLALVDCQLIWEH
jgi:glycosyltransferase involved in cell wall biosynthesis